MSENINNKKNTKIINDIMIEKDYLNFKLNDKKKISVFPKKTSMSENNNNNNNNNNKKKNTKTINNFMTLYH